MAVFASIPQNEGAEIREEDSDDYAGDNAASSMPRGDRWSDARYEP